jgi:hypothetical protein
MEIHKKEIRRETSSPSGTRIRNLWKELETSSKKKHMGDL